MDLKEETSPWTDPQSPWATEGQFQAWLRGTLRRGWTRHPIKNNFIKNNRFKAPLGRFGKDVWAGNCKICNKTHKQNELQVDHITPAGSLGNTAEEVGSFVMRLMWLSTEDLRWLCKECHYNVTAAERFNISLEDAAIRREAIKICKLSVEKQKAWLISHGTTDEKLMRNAKTRREQITKILKHDLSK